MEKEKTLSTIKDIADKAGVSVSTVSRALDPRRKNFINVKTKEKILKIVGKSDFSLNVVARRFKRQKSDAITLILPQNSFRKPSNADFGAKDGFLFWILMEGILKEAKLWRFDVKLEPLFDPESLNEIIESITFPNSDGALLFGSFEMDELIQKIKAKNVPFLVLDTSPSPNYTIPEIAVDIKCGMRDALFSLFKGGHRDIAYIGTAFAKQRFMDRFNSFRSFLEEAGIYKKQLVYDVNNARDISRILNNFNGHYPFSAIMCSNDTMASVLIEKLEDKGIKVPKDISVIGYNDSPIYSEGKKALSTVHIPRKELGAEAVRTLIEIIENRTVFEGKKLIPSSFVQRKTSGPCPEIKRGEQR